MSESADSRLQATCDAIAGYLARHPCAADNEQGIAQWWLADMGLNVPPAVVHQALQRLLQQRRLRGSTLPDGSVIFRAASPDRPAGTGRDA